MRYCVQCCENSSLKPFNDQYTQTLELVKDHNKKQDGVMDSVKQILNISDMELKSLLQDI
eukprot:m.48010 g.48010  ORF g.48010 m.48010 type:complete len:60 (-) comp10544_c0_seq2:992-1171(-)